MTKDKPQGANQEGQCLICRSETNYFFSKIYQPIPDTPLSDGLKVDYWKCANCGFVVSRTHQEMTPEQWEALNASCHHYFESNMEARKHVNQPPYADQALAMILLSRNNIVNLGDTLDYAAGYGTLAKFLGKYSNVHINIFDRYVYSNDQDLSYVAAGDIRKYELVINSAMFEHVVNRESLDEVNNLVKHDGVLMLHTVICERIPNDPNWFYLAPIVHTAFHTNKSMEILMKQWGYAASVYSPQAKSWFLFKEGYPQLERLEEKIDGINEEIQTKYFHYKQGFVDYWKGF